MRWAALSAALAAAVLCLAAAAPRPFDPDFALPQTACGRPL